MKKNLLYTFMLIVISFSACKGGKDKKEEEPSATASINLTAVHSSYYHSAWTPQYYKGDTIRYTVGVSSQKDISLYTATVNGSTVSSISSFTNAQNFTEEFLYILTQNPGESVSIIFKVVESTGKETSNMVSFSVRDLKEYKNLKLFNHETFDGADSLYWVIKHKSKGFSEDYSYVDEEILHYTETANFFSFGPLFSATRTSFGSSSKVFEKKFFTSSTQNRVCKIATSYSDLDEPNEIIRTFSDNSANLLSPVGNKIAIENYSVGDTYIVEYSTTTGIPHTYLVFKITEIYDDGLTSDDPGGHDNDYTKFDIKFFSLSRF